MQSAFITAITMKLAYLGRLKLAVMLFGVFALTQPALALELEVKVVEQGQGVVAEKGMMVAVHYQGRLTDGTVFDDSNKRGEPISFILGQGQVIPGWEQGIEGMTVGEKRVLTIPPELGYGENGAGDLIPPNATLVFDVELVSAITPPTLGESSVQDLEQARKDGIAIIDIRLEQEWLETGVIEGSHTITGFTATGSINPNFLDDFRAVVPEKDTPFILYCRTGNRTGSLGQALVQQLGYSNASHLSNGIVGWTKSGAETIPYVK